MYVLSSSSSSSHHMVFLNYCLQHVEHFQELRFRTVHPPACFPFPRLCRQIDSKFLQWSLSFIQPALPAKSAKGIFLNPEKHWHYTWLLRYKLHTLKAVKQLGETRSSRFQLICSHSSFSSSRRLFRGRKSWVDSLFCRLIFTETRLTVDVPDVRARAASSVYFGELWLHRFQTVRLITVQNP